MQGRTLTHITNNLDNGQFCAAGSNDRGQIMIDSDQVSLYGPALPCTKMVLDEDERVTTMACGYKYTVYYTSSYSTF
jgi:hypothetical protein